MNMGYAAISGVISYSDLWAYDLMMLDAPLDTPTYELVAGPSPLDELHQADFVKWTPKNGFNRKMDLDE